jgi:pyrrolidone-carboxylate peptidase
MSSPILVLGFGAFGSITNNPAAELARRIDGSQAGPHPIIGREMPVSYLRALELTLACAQAIRPCTILGVGVAQSDSHPRLELIGWRDPNPSLPDVDGVIPTILSDHGPESMEAGLGEEFAQRLGVRVSRDPGRYVCNGWLYSTLLRIGPNLPVGFLHVPITGFPAHRLVKALAETHFQEAGASA